MSDNLGYSTNSEYVILIAFHGKYGYAKVPPYYVIRTLPVFDGLCHTVTFRRGSL
jgi:hypothetical protein